MESLPAPACLRKLTQADHKKGLRVDLTEFGTRKLIETEKTVRFTHPERKQKSLPQENSYDCILSTVIKGTTPLYIIP